MRLNRTNQLLNVWKKRKMWSHCKSSAVVFLNAEKLLLCFTRGHCCHSLHKPRSPQTLFFIFSPSRWYHTWNEIMLFLISRRGVLTTASPFLSLVKISWVIQGAVPPLCLRHTGSLLISYLSGEAVIIWGWASTMDNYPGKRISNCGENTAFSKGAWIHKITG